jgi:predicted HTH transcriptional regulator
MLEVYPNHPGYKVAGPSKEAADKMATKAPNLRDQALSIFKQHHRLGLTADELAHLLNVSVLSIRPRLTELVHMNVIEDSGQRRKNNFNSNVTVWRLK